jgi:hypothetical protein
MPILRWDAQPSALRPALGSDMHIDVNGTRLWFAEFVETLQR